MARMNMHHITYKPVWMVEITFQMHKVLRNIQNTKATPEQYVTLTNFKHALDHEWNRIRSDLDRGKDSRQKQFKTRVRKPKEDEKQKIKRTAMKK